GHRKLEVRPGIVHGRSPPSGVGGDGPGDGGGGAGAAQNAWGAARARSGATMRIAVFTDSYLPTVDGVVTSLLSTKRELERLGHEVVVFPPQVPGDGGGRTEDVILVRAPEFRPHPG